MICFLDSYTLIIKATYMCGKFSVEMTVKQENKFLFQTDAFIVGEKDRRNKYSQIYRNPVMVITEDHKIENKNISVLRI